MNTFCPEAYSVEQYLCDVYNFSYLHTLPIYIVVYLYMRTDIELDDALVNQALQISNFRTKKDVVHEALKQYVASLKRKQLLLREEGTWEGDLKLQ